MVAKIIGAVAAACIFFLYFAVIGTEPVLETLLGVVLSLAGGVWAWWEAGRRLGKSRSSSG